MTNRIKSVSQAASAAKAAVPSARKLMIVTDEDVRSNVKHFVKSADHLYNQLSSDVRGLALATDDEVRRDVDRIIASLQDSARNVGRGARNRLDRRALFIGAGFGIVAACLAAAMLYPRTRRRILRVADETRERASTTAHDAREKASSTVDDAREKVSKTVDDAREKVSETAGKLRGASEKA
jgi:gas vesicle protein